MNAEHAERSEGTGAALLPPAVTRWRTPATRTDHQPRLAPPFKVAARPPARVPERVPESVVVEPVAAQPDVAVVEPEVVVEAVPEIQEPVVAALTLAPEFAEEISLSSGAPPLITEPLDMVEFGAMIEPLESIEPGSDDWHDDPLEFAEEIALAAELEAAEAALAPQHETFDVALLTEAAVDEPVNAVAEPALQPAPTLQPAHQDLSARLEQLSHRLRTERPEDLLATLRVGDRLDHLMAGFLAGYLSSRHD